LCRYLSEEQARGRFKLLGVTNFGVKQMEEMEKGGVQIASNQVGKHRSKQANE
jgi:diketogulonate reductase-like aldo/keto reductase